MKTTYRVRDVPRLSDRVRLRLKYLPRAVGLLIVVVLSIPIALVVGFFYPEELRAGIARWNEEIAEWGAQAQREIVHLVEKA